MSEQRYQYITAGVNPQREEPVIVTGKRNATFEVGSYEFERTATLKLPEPMSTEEFEAWKAQSGVDLIDIYFHCLKQKDGSRGPTNPEPEPVGGER